MRVIVCGGRDFSDRGLLSKTLTPYKTPINQKPEHLLISGMAKGADTLAYEFGQVFGIPVLCFFADWAAHGRSAGPIRNQRMIEEGRPDLVIAFPGGTGTADCVKRARKAGIEIFEVKP